MTMRFRGLLAVAGAATLLAAAGCGESSAPPAAKQGNLTPLTKSGRSNEAEGSNSIMAQGQTQRPCGLVSRSRASAIVGAPLLKPVEAPQGPTCIYRAKKGRRMFALSLQSIAFEALGRQLHKPAVTRVARQPAFCVTVGQPTLYVGVSQGRVLSIQASCAMGKRFAEAALSHLVG
jgi:hypothetical protein